jgi:hypothetical protein
MLASSRAEESNAPPGSQSLLLRCGCTTHTCPLVKPAKAGAARFSRPTLASLFMVLKHDQRLRPEGVCRADRQLSELLHSVTIACVCRKDQSA